jgi:UDP-N-acetylglucosamine--N-acetylmuramyl-(pentapeptide) pyrophosphoryl-undecaprenol N-acetylglucosamine transferase
MKTLRIVSYAINGRGMGHLVRQLAILRWVRRITGVLGVDTECWVLTSSEADTLARREGVCAFKMPSKAMMRDAGLEPSRFLSVSRAWTLNIISGLSPSLLLVDTFPGGSFGELIAALEMVPHRVLVARRVREEIENNAAYNSLLPLYEKRIEPDDRETGPIMIREREELMDRDEARTTLGVVGDTKVVYLTLGGGGDVASSQVLPTTTRRLVERGYHVVVGAGPLYSGTEVRGPGITWISRYVPMELFSGLDAAVSAGGYNAFHELMYCGVPTVFAPQPRISDDQESRTLRAHEAGAGRQAESIEEIPDLVAELLADDSASKKASALVTRNGARNAALSALRSLLPAEDLAMASRVLTPSLWAVSNRHKISVSQVLQVVRILSGGTPTELARRKEMLAELSDRGVDLSPVEDDLRPDDRVERFFAAIAEHGAPLDHSMSLLQALRRKFPAASGADLADASETLFQVWGRFDDWMGAVSLLRAVPIQRSYDLRSFASAIRTWLADEEDLFDAQRAFAHLENAGRRPVAEVLRLLARQGSASTLEARA